MSPRGSTAFPQDAYSVGRDGAGAAQLLTFPLLTRTLFPIATHHSLKTSFQRAPKLKDVPHRCLASLLLEHPSRPAGTRCQATTKKNSEHKAVTMAIPVDAQNVDAHDVDIDS